MRVKKLFYVLVSLLFVSCHTLKYVPEDKQLLTATSIELKDEEISKKELKNYLRQQPNSRFWGLFRINLGLYNISGQDTSKWINRSLRKIGEAPVVYEELLTQRSAMAMERYLFSKGYFDSDVETRVVSKGRKIRTIYSISPNQAYRINSYTAEINPQDPFHMLIYDALSLSPVRTGDKFDTNLLNEERSRLVSWARNYGYYAVNKDHFSFEADSTLNKNLVDLRLIIQPYLQRNREGISQYGPHKQFRIRNVFFMLDVPSSVYLRNVGLQGAANPFVALSDYDSIPYENYAVVYRDKPFIKPKVLADNCMITPGDYYDARTVNRTYARFNSMQNMKYVNIRFEEIATSDSIFGKEAKLDCYLVLTPGKNNIISMDVEGTNTAGDLGVAGTLTYSHLNLLRGGETFSTSLRGAYEALSSSFLNDYAEFGGEVGLQFPDFKIPFLSREFKKGVDANTNFKISYDNLSRPEFLRTMAAGTVEYTWRKQRLRQNLNLLDLAYVYMPRVDSAFKANYLTDNSYLKYSYEDHFILRTQYGILYSSVPFGVSNRTFFTIRANVESAGNILSLAYSLLGAEKEGNQAYTIGNIPFSQYVKGEFEYTRSVVLNPRNRFAYRVGMGVAYPYGNSKILPFEKRYFSGGANSVRGWSVRTLGPGSYKSSLSTIDFMNQSGDLKLDINAELRSKLFWVLEGGLFVDVGNIWTLRNYDNQPGGQFQFDEFYKQLACSAGLGLRFDFNFFLVRVDAGMKVFDPSGLSAEDRWRIKHIDQWNDFALHLAIGYPF
ncbi:MAG: BamA/TamA family outer membrane protein [Bacteroidales bacterium]|nr:BamA/TamA family outer membrane protein [Bacteroidales bacterium]MDD3430589.1 BamA/TamA family outer membrane protein [Bacteroidales bacterium]MDD4361040.1 BamA/TamA family outer membrane protein [Bacteroidales bacterium]MDD4430405.1 BamA/TamA family outer membrane protein [Bacteroidales bacterium]